jgi:hypothetical protein
MLIETGISLPVVILLVTPIELPEDADLLGGSLRSTVMLFVEEPCIEGVPQEGFLEAAAFEEIYI